MSAVVYRVPNISLDPLQVLSPSLPVLPRHLPGLALPGTSIEADAGGLAGESRVRLPCRPVAGLDDI